MILDKSQIQDLIKKGASAEIMKARKLSKELNMHVTGLNAQDYLEKLDQYENNAQKILREKLMKSNKSVFSFVLRPLDKIFSAKGGSVNYNLTEKEIAEVDDAISDVADGLNIKRYLKKVVLKLYVIDPNGVLFVDLDEEGKLETRFIRTENILWYSNKGNKVEAIIFEGEMNEDGNKEYRVIDQATDRIFERRPGDDGYEIVELVNETLPNYFGFVPALVVGDIKNPNIDIFESFISDVNEEARELLRDISVNTVHKLAHGYAKYWQRPEACTQCAGEGEVKIPDDPDDEDTTFTTQKCSSCGGLGHKTQMNPSDVMIIPIPDKDEVDAAPNVAGYVNPSIEIWKTYYDNIEKAKNYMFQVLWGTTFEQGGKKETATGRFLDSQPVQDRLRDISHTFSLMHEFLIDCYGRIVLDNPKYKSSVAYGTRYIIESPDEILNTLIEASRENVGDMVIMDLKHKYFTAEYQNDDLELSKKKKISRIDPFPNMDVTTVSSNELIPREDKLKKIYFVGWVSTLTDAQIILNTEEELKNQLNIYITNKTEVNE